VDEERVERGGSPSWLYNEQLTEVHVGGLGGLKCFVCETVSDITLYSIYSGILSLLSVLRTGVI